MSLLEVKEIVCNSCKGTGHKRRTNKLCPNSRWGQIKTANGLDVLFELKESLKKFEEFILQNNITINKLAPAFCSNWMEIECYHGNMDEWKLDYKLQKILFDLHYDIISKIGMYSAYAYKPLEKNDILNIELSERTKIIFGIVGSNVGDIWRISTHTYRKVHYGTITLLKFWGVIVEAINKIC